MSSVELVERPSPGDVLVSDVRKVVSMLIMAWTQSSWGHMGIVASVEGDVVTTHESYPNRLRDRDGVTIRTRLVGAEHVSYVTVARTPEEVELMVARSRHAVLTNSGYGWGEIVRIFLWGLAAWLRVLRLPTVAGWLERLVEWVAARTDNPWRRICSNHVAEVLAALWQHRAAQGDEIAAHMLATESWPPSRQFPGYVDKRLRYALRLYAQHDGCVGT